MRCDFPATKGDTAFLIFGIKVQVQKEQERQASSQVLLVLRKYILYWELVSTKFADPLVN